VRRDQAGREALGQDRTEDRRREQQHEDRVEHVIVEQTLAVGTQGDTFYGDTREPTAYFRAAMARMEAMSCAGV
jgi:hypothetical protein